MSDIFSAEIKEIMRKTHLRDVYLTIEADRLLFGDVKRSTVECLRQQIFLKSNELPPIWQFVLDGIPAKESLYGQSTTL